MCIHSASGTHGSTRRRFSLIELLVVIAVIVILAGLILPALRSARETAKRATCINNQKNFGEYFHQFAMANSGSLNGILGNWKKWLGNVAITAGSTYDFSAEKNKDFYRFNEEKMLDPIALEILKIARCPSDVTKGKQSYGRNDPYGLWTMKDHSKRVVQSRIPDIDAPSDLIILGERWSNFKDLATNSDQQYEVCAPFHLRSYRTDQDATGENWNTIHKGNIPLLYLDGHVKHGSVLATVRTHDPKSFYQFYEKSTGGSWSDDPALKK